MSQQTENIKKRKFNAVDVFIIILVVLCIVGVYFRSQISEWIGVEKNLEDYTLSFEIKCVRYTSAKYLSSGNDVYLDASNLRLGSLEGNCTVLPAYAYLENAAGNTVAVNYPKDTYVDVTGKIKCSGMMKDDGFYLGGNYVLTPGNTLSVHTETVNFIIIITEISK